MNKRGSGLYDYLSNVFSANDRYTNSSNDVLKKYGDNMIWGIEIRRDPIMTVIDKFMNMLSLGKFDEAKKKYNYDVMFHLYAIITLKLKDNSLKQILIEKNQSINISEKIPQKTPKTESINIAIVPNPKLTLNVLLNKTIELVGKEQYFVYNPFSWNCQMFIRNVLEANMLYGGQIEKFVFQPIEKLAQDVGKTTRIISKGLTDTASFSERLFGLGKHNLDGWALHAVLIKDMPLEEAQKIAQHIINNKNKTFYRITKSSIRYRNLPKQKFKKGSFRTKRINKNISLVFGELL